MYQLQPEKPNRTRARAAEKGKSRERARQPEFDVSSAAVREQAARWPSKQMRSGHGAAMLMGYLWLAPSLTLISENLQISLRLNSIHLLLRINGIQSNSAKCILMIALEQKYSCFPYCQKVSRKFLA